jgi:hypothetical protein
VAITRLVRMALRPARMARRPVRTPRGARP